MAGADGTAGAAVGVDPAAAAAAVAATGVATPITTGMSPVKLLRLLPATTPATMDGWKLPRLLPATIELLSIGGWNLLRLLRPIAMLSRLP